MSPILAGVGARADVDDIYRVSQADVVKSPMTPDPRDPTNRAHADRTLVRPAREIGIPDLRLRSGLSRTAD